MNLLLAGIEPTDPQSHAVAWQYLSAASEFSLEGHTIVTLRLPAVWDDCFQPLQDRLNQEWDAVVCLAEKNCDAIAVERIAINEADVAIKDRGGRRPRGKVIEAEGDVGYWTGLPYRELAMRLTDAHLEAVSSHSSGTGLANYVFYRMMHSFSQDRPEMIAGLVHLPDRKIHNEQAERFVEVLVSCLDQKRVDGDRLRLDLDKIRARSEGHSHLL